MMWIARRPGAAAQQVDLRIGRRAREADNVHGRNDEARAAPAPVG